MWFVGIILALLITIAALAMMYAGLRRIGNLLSYRPCCVEFTFPLAGAGYVTAVFHCVTGLSLSVMLVATMPRWFVSGLPLSTLDLVVSSTTFGLMVATTILRCRMYRNRWVADHDVDFVAHGHVDLPNRDYMG